MSSTGSYVWKFESRPIVQRFGRLNVQLWEVDNWKWACRVCDQSLLLVLFKLQPPHEKMQPCTLPVMESFLHAFPAVIFSKTLRQKNSLSFELHLSNIFMIIKVTNMHTHTNWFQKLDCVIDVWTLHNLDIFLFVEWLWNTSNIFARKSPRKL